MVGLALAGPGTGIALASVPDYATVTGYAAGTSTNNLEGTWGSDCTKTNDPGGSTYVLTQDYAKVIVKAGSDQSTDDHANTVFDNPKAGQTVWADSNGSGAFDLGDKTISHIIFCGPTTTTTTSTSSTGTETTGTTTTGTETTGTTTTGTETTGTTTTSTTTTSTETTGTTTIGTETTGTETTGTTTTGTTTIGTSSAFSGDVEGATGTPKLSGVVDAATGRPRVTPPPTDTLPTSGTPNGDSWRLVLMGLAALLATVLLLTPVRATTRR
jgi:mucin-2